MQTRQLTHEGLPGEQSDAFWICQQEIDRRPKHFGVAIDPEDAAERDDAIWAERVKDKEYFVRVLVVDAGMLLRQPGVIAAARRHGDSRYDGAGGSVDGMLPQSIHQQALHLNPDLYVPTVTIEFTYAGGRRYKDRVQDVDIYKSASLVECMSYESFDEALVKEGRDFSYHDTLLLYNQMRRDQRKPKIQAEQYIGASQQSKAYALSAYIVQECMIVANTQVAQQAERADLPWLYRSQTPRLPLDLPEDGIYDMRSLLMTIFQDTTLARYGTQPRHHLQLRRNRYSHFTSPLRRFADLCNHLTQHAFLTGAQLPFNREELGEIAEEINSRRVDDLLSRRDLVYQLFSQMGVDSSRLREYDGRATHGPHGQNALE